jgi:hypothetical protein
LHFHADALLLQGAQLLSQVAALYQVALQLYAAFRRCAPPHRVDEGLQMLSRFLFLLLLNRSFSQRNIFSY